MRFLLYVAALCLWAGAALAAGPQGFNGSGSVTRPANTTGYTTGHLLAANTTGTAVSTPVTVGSGAGDNLIVGARLFTTGSGASAATYKVFLFAAGATPTLTALVDGSAYIGPYKADLGSLVGVLTCPTPAATNDGTAGYYVDCTLPASGTTSGLRFSGTGGTTTVLRATFEVTATYTPTSGEVVTLFVAAISVQ